mgnify:CR=1 FL=1
MSVLKALTHGILLLWPFMVLGIARIPALEPLLWVMWVACALALLFAARPSGSKPPQIEALGVRVLALALVTLSLITRSTGSLLWYPVLVNASLLATFAQSLLPGRTPLIARIAALHDTNLEKIPAAQRYLRRLTGIWCAFFIINGSIALATVIFADIDIWTLWNGCLSYVAVALLLGAEWLLRPRFSHD